MKRSLPRENFLPGQGEIFLWAGKNESGTRGASLTDLHLFSFCKDYSMLSWLS